MVFLKYQTKTKIKYCTRAGSVLVKNKKGASEDEDRRKA